MTPGLPGAGGPPGLTGPPGSGNHRIGFVRFAACRWGRSGLSWNRQAIPGVAAWAAKSCARFRRDISTPGRR